MTKNTARRGDHGREKEAYADALAGVVASLISLWAFYPIDVWKTRVQGGEGKRGGSPLVASTAATTATRRSSNGENDDNGNGLNNFKELYAGWQLKSLHASTSSFCYFYLYSWIVSYWLSKGNKTQYQPKKSMKNLPTSTRLALSAVAAMLNTFVSMPLDGLSARLQAKRTKLGGHKRHSIDKSSTEEEAQRYPASSSEDDEEEGASLAAEDKKKEPKHPVTMKRSDSSVVEEFMARWKARSSSFIIPQVLPSGPSILRRQSSIKRRRNGEEHCVDDDRDDSKSSSSLWSVIMEFKSLWKGFVPSLLLCSNPAIHYTVFDTIKYWVLATRERRQQQQWREAVSSNSRAWSSTTPGAKAARSPSSSLNMAEAFVVGIIAKFVATIVTYPLIRAKVMIMITSRTSMIGCLVDEYRKHGPTGLYKGCHLQLLHTLLKSAVLMMVKERITRTTRRIVLQPTTAVGN